MCLFPNLDLKHIENLPMDTDIFVSRKKKKKKKKKKNENFVEKKNIVLILLLKTLIVVDSRDGSNEYPQSLFWIKNMTNRYTPAYLRFTI